MTAATLDTILDQVVQLRDEVSDLPARIRISAGQVVTVNGLSDIDASLGLVKAGEFRSGNINAPGDGFDGVRIAYPPMLYNGTEYNIVGIENDTLQFGLRASDGVAVFGGGNVFLSNEGLTIVQGTSANRAIKWHVSQSDNSLTGQIINWFTEDGGGAGIDLAQTLVMAGGDNELNTPTAHSATVGMKAVANVDGTTGESIELKLIRSKSPGAGTEEGLHLLMDADYLFRITSDGALSFFSSTSQTYALGMVDADTLRLVNNEDLSASNQAIFEINTRTSPLAFIYNPQGRDIDFRVEGDTEPNLLFVDAGLDAIGLGEAADSDDFLTINGTVHINNAQDVGLSGWSGGLKIGAKNGTHIAIDNNEIMAKSDDTTAATLNLQVEGGNVHIGTPSINTGALRIYGGTGVGSAANLASLWVEDIEAGKADFRVRTEYGHEGRILNTAAIGYNSGTQSIPNVTFTVLNLNTALFDNEGDWVDTTNNRLQVNEAGEYLVHIQNFNIGSSTTGFRELRVRDNFGSTVCQTRDPAATSVVRMETSGFVSLVAGGWVQAEIYQSSGGNLTVGSFWKLGLMKIS